MNEIQAFVAVVRAGSLTTAGKQLHTSKATLSRQVSRLEELFAHSEAQPPR